MIEPSEQYEIANERLNEMVILQNELQSLREKLRESEGEAAAMRRILIDINKDRALPSIKKFLPFIEEDIREALSSKCGTEILKELENLKKHNNHLCNETIKLGAEIDGLRAKLAVAVEALKSCKICREDFDDQNYERQYFDQELVEQALAKINEKGEV